MIRRFIIFLALLSASAIYAQTPKPGGLTPNREISITKADGGSVQTSSRTGVNLGSSVHRRWFIINDTTCPVTLGNVGPSPHYVGPSYQLDAQGFVQAAENILAFEILFPMFDLWGDHMHTLSLNHVEDLAPKLPLRLEGSWYATENDVREYFTAVAFVDKVMTADGKIWRADRKLITQKLAEVQIQVSESGLDRDEAKPPR
jgi:hypothetical protein